jgi:ubiquinone/menaquinone biosynthesis C-methylase UbiE
MPSGSISFDPAADYYDATRSLEPATQEAVTALLAYALAARGPCLEIGVGTGRIAVDLARAGVEIVGVDLSERMVSKLRGKSPGALVAVGDATALPFASDAFGGAFACHVLHLIPDWRKALRELARVVRRGGVVLVDTGGQDGVRGEVRRRFAREAGRDRVEVGLEDPKDLDRAMSEIGATARELEPIVERRRRSLEELISKFEDNLFAFTWSLDAGTRRRAAATVRAWAARRFGSLDAPRDFDMRIVWRAYDLS